jgi:p-cumate 2,3-dioxygenase beta subunit
VSNVRVLASSREGELSVRCAFLTHRTRAGVTDTFIGSSQYRLVREDGQLRIREKRCRLDFDNLYEQGRISILL